MKIEILGTGCKKCSDMFELVKKAIATKGIFAQVEKVEDLNKIMEYSVMSTPALVINGIVKSSGKVLSEEEIINYIS
ncbi:MAG: thioredoxin family protein [Campylobacterales bacterium]|nr:thioredoxin family protein [Campylobacterales bacterium]NQY21450.1 TM0996/MTH895 family glutaredoxin-like protein [Campylobacteraceae bacterium]